MARAKSRKAASDSRLLMMALGLLVGFVVAFVLVLARLPVNGIFSQAHTAPSQNAAVAEMDFDYYSVLQAQQAQRKPLPQVVAVEPPVIFMEAPADIPLQGRVQAQVPVQPQIQAPAVAQQQKVRVPQAVQAPSAPVVADASRQASAPAAFREVPASSSGQDFYYVEAGNYREDRDAVQVQAALRNVGIEAFIVVRQNNNGQFGHRVRIGPFFEQSRLDTTRRQLREKGISPRLIRVKG